MQEAREPGMNVNINSNARVNDDGNHGDTGVMNKMYIMKAAEIPGTKDNKKEIAITMVLSTIVSYGRVY